MKLERKQQPKQSRRKKSTLGKRGWCLKPMWRWVSDRHMVGSAIVTEREEVIADEGGL